MGKSAWNDLLTEDARAALETALEPSERVQLVAAAVGCGIVRTMSLLTTCGCSNTWA